MAAWYDENHWSVLLMDIQLNSLLKFMLIQALNRFYIIFIFNVLKRKLSPEIAHPHQWIQRIVFFIFISSASNLILHFTEPFSRRLLRPLKKKVELMSGPPHNCFPASFTNCYLLACLFSPFQSTCVIYMGSRILMSPCPFVVMKAALPFSPSPSLRTILKFLAGKHRSNIGNLSFYG